MFGNLDKLTYNFMGNSQYRIAVIGLGYVGLPLAVEFSKYFPVVGFDINKKRIDELMHCHDHTLEVAEPALKEVMTDHLPVVNCKGLYCSHLIDDISACNVYFVTVPTP